MQNAEFLIQALGFVKDAVCDIPVKGTKNCKQVLDSVVNLDYVIRQLQDEIAAMTKPTEPLAERTETKEE